MARKQTSILVVAALSPRVAYETPAHGVGIEASIYLSRHGDFGIERPRRDLFIGQAAFEMMLLQARHLGWVA